MNGKIEPTRAFASVVYLGIHGFAGKSIAEQAALSARLDSSIAAAVMALDKADCMVLDSADGAAIVVLGDPRAALDAADAVAASGGEAPKAFVIGINHGPVKLEGGTRNDAMLRGDGIDTAVAIAALAPAGELRVTRAYRDALAVASPTDAAGFHGAGTVIDANVRTYELFSRDRNASAHADRRVFVFAALASMAILAGGVAARFALERLAAARQPASLIFDIRPQGDIYVDGVLKGKAPGIASLQVAPGSHTIEVRNGRYPPFTVEVNLAPGEQMEVKHSFSAPAKRKAPGLLERLKFWQ